MTRLRETPAALLFAAACGSAPIESTTIFANEDSSSSGAASSEVGSTEPGSTSSSTNPVTDASTDATTTDDPSDTTTMPGTSESGDDTSTSDCAPILHEVLYDPDSGNTDDGFEWIELYNPCSDTIDLGTYQLRWGGEGYVDEAALAGELESGGCIVIGGPTSTPQNADPTIDLELNFEPDFENADSAADAIALFRVGEDVPVDAVIYGDENFYEFIDETGRPGAPDVKDVARGHSIAREDETPGAAWADNNEPSPNVCPNLGL